MPENRDRWRAIRALMSEAIGRPRTGSWLRAWREDETGGVLVEFTVILPVLLSLTLGVVQYGLLLFVYNNMFDAARQASRELAVGVSNETQATATATGLLADWPTTWNVTAQDVGTTGTDNVRVVITVPAAEASIIDFVPMPAQLRAEVVMRKE